MKAKHETGNGMRIVASLVAALSLAVSGCATTTGMQPQEVAAYYGYTQRPDYVSGLAWGTLGGVLGSQVGKGRGSLAAAGAGAALGTLGGTGCPLNGGAILGSALGGVIGAQVGKGRGRTIASAVGAAYGSLAGCPATW